MSWLSEYEHRTAWKHEPINGCFPTHEGLTGKVGPDGRYLPFLGSTAVFRLDRRGALLAEAMQNRLRQGLAGTGMLAASLPASTFHMTLHDLVCPERTRTAAVYADEGRTGAPGRPARAGGTWHSRVRDRL